MLPPIRVAIACPEREAELWAMVEDAGFTVDGRTCAFAGPCASVAELREALASGAADVVLVSATLNAIPYETLHGLARSHRVVVLAADAASERWQRFHAPVLGADPNRGELSLAIADALARGGRVRPGSSTRRAHKADESRPVLDTARHAAEPRSEVIAVTKPCRGDGVTLVATGLAFATGVFEERTVLVDLNTRAGSVEFHLGVNPARNVAQLVRRAEEGQQAEVPWDSLLQSELQAMGPPSHGHVLCGITRLSQRTQLTATSFNQLVSALRERYRYIFLATSGAGWTVDDPEVDQVALRMADRVLVLVRPDVEGITLARRVLQDWPRQQQVHVLLNQVGLPDQVSRPDVEAKLQAPVVAELPFDPWKVAEARARNRPVVCQRSCRLALPLINLAGRIVGGRIELAPDEPARTTAWWQRLPVPVAGALR
jgi:MinD-like ATPase involved in chromosome partitioning or flagellar assembly